MQTKLFKPQKVTYLLPHEHGVWAMMLVPFLLGTAIGQACWRLQVRSGFWGQLCGCFTVACKEKRVSDMKSEALFCIRAGLSRSGSGRD